MSIFSDKLFDSFQINKKKPLKKKEETNQFKNPNQKIYTKNFQKPKQKNVQRNKKKINEKSQIKNNLENENKEDEDDEDSLIEKEKIDKTISAEIGEVFIENCLHEVSLPEGYDIKGNEDIFNPIYPQEPARNYPFKLDPFQKTGIACLNRGDSVIVSAHTSAGKTVVAEYAIAQALKNNARVIYTSPIKALSNQKYRELSDEFKDAGLMTGDVTINPNSSCIVMTTEILRNMLYRGSEILREVQCVIFDEIHYMKDIERGVVWEETIILLPDTIRFVFLSATIPNAKEFSDWIAKIHSQPCHVVYSDVRPIPLQHYVFPAGGNGLYLVVDEQGNFREKNFQKAMSVISNAPNQYNDRRPQNQKYKSDIYKIINLILERKFEPVIVFSFSRKECEIKALKLAKMDLNDENEKTLVDEIFTNAIDSLSDEDKKIPAVQHILPLLKRGIAIHHSGLLPILKEVIEILFQEGLVKVLFATETFSMGLNMPAKTVIFSSVRKFDGSSFRYITCGEYTQMSGRAGRRGLDQRGIVITMLDEKMEPSDAKNTLRGDLDPLNSTFHLSYNMLLNLLRVEDIDPEYLLSKSFHQFQNERKHPELQENLQKLQLQFDSLNIEEEKSVTEFHSVKQQIDNLKQKIKEITFKPVNILPFLQQGRLVKIKTIKQDWDWGIMIDFEYIYDNNPKGEIIINGEATDYVMNIIIETKQNSNSNSNSNINEEPEAVEETNRGNGEMKILQFPLLSLDQVSLLRVPIPNDVRRSENVQHYKRVLSEIRKRFEKNIPLLDPVKDMKISDKNFNKFVERVNNLEGRMINQKIFQNNQMTEEYQKYQEKLNLQEQIDGVRKSLKESEDVLLKENLKYMKRVLRKLGYTNNENIIETKGRIACEISSGDELLITEMIFSGAFNEMEVEQIVALSSCFVFQEKVDEMLKLREELETPFQKLQSTARSIAMVAQECRVDIDIDRYVESFKPNLMEVVYEWAKGKSFLEISKMTNIFEGSVIRTMRRLDEILRQMCAAARAIGNGELEEKFAQGITKIKRDVVFAASLYL
ncbi:exosome RNA helicase mtr4 [Anaeramoeba ignava]|uniref:Exosome RNA helicase mtr4 n=1 Tax=Anaeramoeba ignava TaxID=1746090 RepID=A0A9Q0M0K9_ANAIG|nr:exosome RNA helicase mtr4 [Anaeramoeba ignava]